MARDCNFLTVFFWLDSKGLTYAPMVSPFIKIKDSVATFTRKLVYFWDVKVQIDRIAVPHNGWGLIVWKKETYPRLGVRLV